MVEWYGVNGNGGVGKWEEIVEIEGIVRDELVSKVVDGDMGGVVVKFDEVGKVVC